MQRDSVKKGNLIRSAYLAIGFGLWLPHKMKCNAMKMLEKFSKKESYE